MTTHITPGQRISITRNGREMFGHITRDDDTGEYVFVSRMCVACDLREGDEIGTGAFSTRYDVSNDTGFKNARVIYMCAHCVRKAMIARVIQSGIDRLMQHDETLCDALEALHSIDEFNANSCVPYQSFDASCREMIGAEFDRVCDDAHNWIQSIVHAAFGPT
jgi:hypothetical protein